MKCRICGRDNENDAVKCKKCNALLRRPEEPVPAPAPAGDASKLLLWAAVGAVLVIAAVAAFLVRSVGSREEPPKAESASPAPIAIEKQIASELQRMEDKQEQAIAELGLAELYSAATFATREAVMKSSFAMKEAEERAAGHEDEWRNWRDTVVKRIQASGLDSEKKLGLSRKVEAALAKSESSRTRARAASRQWAYATLEVYDYAASNGEHIDAGGGEVRIRHPEVETGFRSRLTRAQRLQQEAARLTQQAKQTRHALLGEAGITLAD